MDAKLLEEMLWGTEYLNNAKISPHKPLTEKIMYFYNQKSGDHFKWPNSITSNGNPTLCVSQWSVTKYTTSSVKCSCQKCFTWIESGPKPNFQFAGYKQVIEEQVKYHHEEAEKSRLWDSQKATGSHLSKTQALKKPTHPPKNQGGF